MSNSSVTVAAVGPRAQPVFTAAHSYCSYFGKKIDSEPGRCGGRMARSEVLQRCHPDSKYCERHMNRSRNRSRKLSLHGLKLAADEKNFLSKLWEYKELRDEL
uniref:Uncharacterized protein n=1 Tax=Salix viminalis TaxID=40686 RepID=A0A6N2MJL9_SALVM